MLHMLVSLRSHRWIQNRSQIHLEWPISAYVISTKGTLAGSLGPERTIDWQTHLQSTRCPVIKRLHQWRCHSITILAHWSLQRSSTAAAATRSCSSCWTGWMSRLPTQHPVTGWCAYVPCDNIYRWDSQGSWAVAAQAPRFGAWPVWLCIGA